MYFFSSNLRENIKEICMVHKFIYAYTLSFKLNINIIYLCIYSMLDYLRTSTVCNNGDYVIRVTACKNVDSIYQ